jgi:potassium voltage-gated channel Eag-related subfamily H protein 8
MTGGIAFFSYIISNFNEVLTNFHKKMGYIDKTQEVEEWILQLSNNSLIINRPVFLKQP